MGLNEPWDPCTKSKIFWKRKRKEKLRKILEEILKPQTPTSASPRRRHRRRIPASSYGSPAAIPSRFLVRLASPRRVRSCEAAQPSKPNSLSASRCLRRSEAVASRQPKPRLQAVAERRLQPDTTSDVPASQPNRSADLRRQSPEFRSRTPCPVARPVASLPRRSTRITPS